MSAVEWRCAVMRGCDEIGGETRARGVTWRERSSLAAVKFSRFPVSLFPCFLVGYLGTIRISGGEVDLEERGGGGKGSDDDGLGSADSTC
jgi:hypothetical protein